MKRRYQMERHRAVRSFRRWAREENPNLQMILPLASTNVIESAFSMVETVCRNGKRWRPGEQIERWVGSGLLVAERQFRKVRGFREIPLLLASLANAVSRKSVVNETAAA